MKLWRVSQTERSGWDTFDAMVVAASTEEVARHTHPSKSGWKDGYVWATSPNNVTVEYLGVTDRKFQEGQIILSSFNAG